MRINYSMDRQTFYKIAILEKQCKAYLILAKLAPNGNIYHKQAVKCLQLAKIIYNDWKENSTQTLIKVA